MSNLNSTTPYIKDWLLPSSGQTKYNWQWAKQDLEFLNAKLTAVTRDVSVYDFYNITTVIQDINEYDIKVNNLLPGQSAIIGAESITTSEAVLSRGDIIFKLQDYSLQIVRGVRGGVFYPSKIEQRNGSYTLKFTNTSITPEDGTAELTVDGAELLTPMKEIDITGLTTTSNAHYYNAQIMVPSINRQISFNQISQSVPVIKWYTSNSEEIYWDYALTADVGSNQYIIENIPSCISYAVIK